jgi:hypothetical protein
MLALFAQRGGQVGVGAGDGDGLALGGLLAAYGVVLAIAIAVQIMFLLSLSKCLKQISPRNRRMEPGQVWLALIPIFGFIWTIIMVLKIADSLRDEFEDRGFRGDGDFGKTIGLVFIIGSFICGPVGLVCWIMYWLKINGYRKQLEASGRGKEDYDDEEDDRPRRKSRRRDEEEEDLDEDDRPRRRR